MADILLVDDDADVVVALEFLLGLEGHTVRVARHGEEGLRRLSERLPDAVVLDVDMPVLDGPSMAREMIIRDCGQEAIPVVLVSGNSDLDALAARVGTPYVLAKPTEPGELLTLIQRALTERTPPSADKRAA
jgi:CheY-like chemotaxis protein